MKIEAKVYVPEDRTDPFGASAMNLDVTIYILGFGFGFKGLDISDIQWHLAKLLWNMTETSINETKSTCQPFLTFFTTPSLHVLWQ